MPRRRRATSSGSAHVERWIAGLVLALALLGCSETAAEPFEADVTDAAEATEATAPYPAERAYPAVRNVVLVSLDTLRAENLGCYGYKRHTSPNLDAFAEGALLFANATASSSSTTPSHMSMFTGLEVPVHGQLNVTVRNGTAVDPTVLPRTIPMLAERLAEAGMTTIAFTDGGFLTSEMHFDRGFREFDSTAETVDKKIDRVLERLEQLDPEQGTFLFVHTYEIHAPYVPPVEHDVFSDPHYTGLWRERVERLRESSKLGGASGSASFLPRPGEADWNDRRYLVDVYDGGIHFTDEQLGRLLDVLGSEPWAPNTAVIVLSDHGEAFKEHGTYSHQELYQTVTHVPFLVSVPGLAPGVVEENVAGVDVTPTVLDLLGLPAPMPSDGISVLRRLDAQRLVMSFMGNPSKSGGTSVRIGDTKVMRNLAKVPWELFDLGKDPRERSPQPLDGVQGEAMLARIEEETARLLNTATVLREGAVEERSTLSPETIAALQALGYVGEDG